MFVEVRNAKGVLTARIRVTGERVRVGRAPDNDVVVEDEYVDAHHLEARPAEGGAAVRVHDLGSTNGTRLNDVRLGSDETLVPFGTAVQLGRSHLVFRSATAAVADARALPEEEPKLFAYDRWPAWSALGVAMLVFTAGAWFISYDPFGVAEVVGFALIFGVFLLFWAGAWAVGTRAFTGRSRFRQHLAFASVFTIPYFACTTVLTWLGFAADSPSLNAVIGYGLTGFLAWSLGIFGHVDIASRRSRAFKAAISGLAGLAAVLLAAAVARADLGPTFQIHRSLSTISPVPTALTRSTSLDDFEERLTALGTELEKAAAEALAKRKAEEEREAPAAPDSQP